MISFKPKRVPAKPTVTEITLPKPYREYFNTMIARQSYPFLLESSLTNESNGRYSFMGSSPFLVLSSKGERITVRRAGSFKTMTGNPFEVLSEILKNFKPTSAPNDTPMTGGIVGYFGYDLRHFIEKLPRNAADDLPFPDLHLACYDRILCIDHATSKIFLVNTDYGERRISEEEKAAPTTAEDAGESAIRSNFTREGYLAAVAKAKEYIAAGDIYQVNLSQRFQTRLPDRRPLDIYNALRSVSPASYSAYISCGGGRALISSSPEEFLTVRGERIVTRPIKGTRPRGANDDEDRALRDELWKSAKDDAELSMIVDLERNDIGKVCRYGTVQVTTPKILDSFPTVNHLSAIVEGQLRKEASPVDILKATFPGGSVTGAPKIRAMEIIDELEPTCRGPYTGALGFIGFNGTMNLSVAIRIMLCHGGTVTFQVGGGIVADSDPSAEYEETLVKARGIFQGLGIEYRA